MDTKTDQRVYKRLARIGFFCVLMGLGWLLWCCKVSYAQMDWETLKIHMQPYFEDITDAIYLAEGGEKAKKPFGILSVQCNGYEDCRKIAYNTVRNNYRRWIQGGRVGEYLAFLGNRYAPVGAENDPRGLNNNWVRNVTAIYERNQS